MTTYPHPSRMSTTTSQSTSQGYAKQRRWNISEKLPKLLFRSFRFEWDI